MQRKALHTIIMALFLAAAVCAGSAMPKNQLAVFTPSTSKMVTENPGLPVPVPLPPAA